MDTPPFKSDIFYSVQNEDYETELAVLQRIERSAPLRVLMIASSGENVLSVLTDERVGSVDAVDLNPAQLHLCELRRTALHHLGRDEQLQLLGADPLSLRAGNEALRLALYDRICSWLPEASRAFWDVRRESDLAFGVHHVGRNDVGMHDVQARLHNAGFRPLEQALSDAELPTWRKVYTDLMTPAYMRELFGLPSEALAARIAGIAGTLGEYHFRALQQPHPEHNPFVTTVFANAYATAAGEDGLPRYLQLEGQAALHYLGIQERLRLHTGNFLEQLAPLAVAYGPFDLISISNIAEWLSEAQLHTLVTQARDHLRSGGALLARTATGVSTIVDVIGQHLQIDDTFDRVLAQVERGPWFRIIAAGFR